MFSICIPSRGRPEMLFNAIACAIKTARNQQDVHIYAFIDHDDPKRDDYIALQQRFPPTVHMYYDHDQQLSPGKAWDWLARKAMADGTDYLMLGSDDLYFKTNDWDIIMQPHLKKYPDNIFCMWFNDLIYGDIRADHPIIHRKWMETIGYFVHKDFNILYADGWTRTIARRINRLVYVPEIIAEHHNVPVNPEKGGKRPADETWLRSREIYAKGDHVAYSKLQTELLNDVIKLLHVMDLNV